MRRALVVMLVLVGLAGCGSDDDGGDAATSDTTAVTGSSSTGDDTPVELSGKVNDEGRADAAGDATIEVEADDFYFKPTFVKVEAGQKLTVELKNEGQAKHTFTSTELNVDEEVAAGASASVEVTVPDDGDAFLFFCRFHQGGGMQGAFYTRDGATVGGAPSGGASGY